MSEKQTPSDLVRDITEPDWREREARRTAMLKSIMEVVPPAPQRPIIGKHGAASSGGEAKP